MPSRGGPASRNAIDPKVLVAFLDAWSDYRITGTPKRRRLHVNGTAINENDARMIRRWRMGGIQGVTLKSARLMLDRYGLTFDMLVTYGEQTNANPIRKGSL